MGLFRKKKKNEEKVTDYKWLTVDEALKASMGEAAEDGNAIANMAKQMADLINNAESIQKEAKLEYTAVAKHLCDIERLTKLSDKSAARITDTARTIYNLENQRAGYQQGARRITGERYNTMELYADVIPDQIKSMQAKENYLMLVQNDMRQLEGEKGSIKYEKECAVNKRQFLTKFTYVCIAVVIVLFIMFFVLSDKLGIDFRIPFLITGAIVCGYAAYFYVTMASCSTTIKRCDALNNRAVELLNKVKIKYVNTQNSLDYVYEKYKCNSHQELAYIWQNYVLEKEDEERYKKNSQLLSTYQTMLVEELREIGFEIPDIWAHQAEVLFDKHAMFEMKHVLDERHRKLSAQLDFSRKQIAGLDNDIVTMCKKFPEQESLIRRIIREECDGREVYIE